MNFQKLIILGKKLKRYGNLFIEKINQIKNKNFVKEENFVN